MVVNNKELLKIRHMGAVMRLQGLLFDIVFFEFIENKKDRLKV